MAKNSGDMKQRGSLGDRDDVEKVFKKFDANGEGNISVSELKAILKTLGTETLPEELRRIMAEIDKDGDDFIDFEEFAAFYGGGDRGNTKEFREAFDLYDSDKNDGITTSELHAVLNSLGEKCTLKDCSRMISSVDMDGDGSVNFEGFG